MSRERKELSLNWLLGCRKVSKKEEIFNLKRREDN